MVTMMLEMLNAYSALLFVRHVIHMKYVLLVSFLITLKSINKLAFVSNNIIFLQIIGFCSNRHVYVNRDSMMRVFNHAKVKCEFMSECDIRCATCSNGANICTSCPINSLRIL